MSWFVSNDRIQNHGRNKEIKTVFDEVMDRHRNEPKNGADADNRPSEQCADRDGNEQIARRPPLEIREQTHREQHTSAQPSENDYPQQWHRPLDAGPGVAGLKQRPTECRVHDACR